MVKRLANAQPKSEILTRVKRSQVINLVQGQCTSNSDCVGPQYGTNVPANLVRCETTTGVCMCNNCFVRLNNSCEVISPLCRSYSTVESQCTDHRKSQKTTFLLSVFLSGVGAANFYIGDNLLGERLVIKHWYKYHDARNVSVDNHVNMYSTTPV